VHPCLNTLVTLKHFVIRFPIFILELDPSYNAFIASINFVFIANPSRISLNIFNGILPFAFDKSINNKCNSLLLAFFFSKICVMQKILYIHGLLARKPAYSSIFTFLCSNSTNFANIHPNILLNVLATDKWELMGLNNSKL